jgi:SAM-dependent methyltransferase
MAPKWLISMLDSVLAPFDLILRRRSSWGSADFTEHISIRPKNSAEEIFNLLQAPLHYSNAEASLQLPEGLLERDLEFYLDKDTYPLPATEDRQGYEGDRHYDYWLTGLRDYRLIVQSLCRFGLDLTESSQVLEFGCSTGRVLRHFACQEDGLGLWGTDINGREIEWIRRNLPTHLKVFQCTTLPFLPIPDNSLSLVYAFSVFTHIDEFETAWLAELRRVLKPGGFAYLTMHSEHTWKSMPETLEREFLNSASHIQGYKVTPELLRGPMPKPKTVFRHTLSRLYNVNVFHDTAYIHDTWGRFFDVLEIMVRGHGYQDCVLLRKPFQ